MNANRNIYMWTHQDIEMQQFIAAQQNSHQHIGVLSPQLQQYPCMLLLNDRAIHPSVTVAVHQTHAAAAVVPQH